MKVSEDWELRSLRRGLNWSRRVHVEYGRVQEACFVSQPLLHPQWKVLRTWISKTQSHDLVLPLWDKLECYWDGIKNNSYPLWSRRLETCVKPIGACTCCEKYVVQKASSIFQRRFCRHYVRLSLELSIQVHEDKSHVHLLRQPRRYTVPYLVFSCSKVRFARRGWPVGGAGVLATQRICCLHGDCKSMGRQVLYESERVQACILAPAWKILSDPDSFPLVCEQLEQHLGLSNTSQLQFESLLLISPGISVGSFISWITNSLLIVGGLASRSFKPRKVFN